MRRRLPGEMIEKLAEMRDDLDWPMVAGCATVGFLAGVLASWWWRRRSETAARRREESEHRMAMTFPFS